MSSGHSSDRGLRKESSTRTTGSGGQLGSARRLLTRTESSASAQSCPVRLEMNTALHSANHNSSADSWNSANSSPTTEHRELAVMTMKKQGSSRGSGGAERQPPPDSSFKKEASLSGLSSASRDYLDPERSQRTAATTDGDPHDSKNNHNETPADPEGALMMRAASGADDASENDHHTITNQSSTLTHKSSVFGAIHWFRELTGRIVNDDRVQIAIILLIVANAIMMGVGTFDFVAYNPAVKNAFDTADQIFLIIFTVELGLQFIYHGFHMFIDGWLLFDFVIVVLSWSLDNVQVFRAFRIFRAFRLITRLPVLKNLVMALFEVAPSMTAIIALLVLILYIYSVMCTSLFYNMYEKGQTDKDYFGTLDASLFTLFAMMTLEWASVVRQVMDVYWYSSIVFSSFLVFSSFILYSLVIAVICDAVKVTEHSDDMEAEDERREEMWERMHTLEKRVQDLSEQQGDILERLQSTLQAIQRQQRRRNREVDVDCSNSSSAETMPLSKSQRPGSDTTSASAKDAPLTNSDGRQGSEIEIMFAQERGQPAHTYKGKIVVLGEKASTSPDQAATTAESRCTASSTIPRESISDRSVESSRHSSDHMRSGRRRRSTDGTSLVGEMEDVPKPRLRKSSSSVDGDSEIAATRKEPRRTGKPRNRRASIAGGAPPPKARGSFTAAPKKKYKF